MTTDPKTRIVWYEGNAYPVSNSPPNQDAGKYWYVLVDDEWRRLFACAKEQPSVNSWARIEERILEWLRKRNRR